MHVIQYRKHRVSLSTRCPLKIDVNKMFAHRIQLPRKPEPKEVDITYGKKVKEISCREKTSKEEWKEREASTNPTVPTRIKIFEGGSVSTTTVYLLPRQLQCLYYNNPLIEIQSWLIICYLSFRYKSNEDYVYVRGRGRGKYICEECGIRCKKPSMLKKHIRTHTDVRPYICRVCNFAFKTKGTHYWEKRKKCIVITCCYYNSLNLRTYNKTFYILQEI